MLGAVRSCGRRGEGKLTENDWVGGEDGEVWMQFLHNVRGASKVDTLEGTLHIRNAAHQLCSQCYLQRGGHPASAN